MAVTTAEERRKKREAGLELTFPEYGDVVAIRPLDEGFFLQAGMIPDFLAPVVQELLGTGKIEKLPSPEKNEKWLTFLDKMVKFAYLHPKVVDQPQGDDEIAIEDVGYSDKVFLYSFFGSSANILRAFRARQIQSLATVDVAKNNGHLTEQVPSREPVGE